MARKKQRPLPPGGRRTSAGRVTITIPCEVGGEQRRLSQNKILPSEPRSYADVDEAWEGYQRVRDYLAQRVDRDQTMLGFWERWTDEDDWRWGHIAGRSADTLYVYKARTRAFVARFANRPVASMIEQDVRDYMRAGGMASQLPTIARFFKDAATEGLILANPAGELAREADKGMAKLRKAKASDPPKIAAVNRMLERATDPAYPRSLYAWLLTGTRTGMRGGELDGMEWEYVDGDVYHIEWQLHYRTNQLQRPKHDSRRPVRLDDDVLAEIERVRPNGSRYIWLNPNTCNPWRHDARREWWSKRIDGQPSLAALVGDVTPYVATRHHWASHALNVLGITPYAASLLYGHSDGGKLLTDTYAKPDVNAALDAVRAATATQPVDLAARRRRVA
jgi:hypothetical protein